MRPHIVVATPCYGGNVTAGFTNSLLGLQAACLQREIDISFRLIGGDALITRARNILVQQFLAETEASHLLFIDADISFAPEQALALLEADKDIVGGIYPLKRMDWPRLRLHEQVGSPDPVASSLNYVVELLDGALPAPEQAFVQVRSIGTGFMMIKRAVFARMAEHYPNIRFQNIHVAASAQGLAEQTNCAYFDCVIDTRTGTYLSEDYTFCRRWTDMGGEIWAYCKSKLTHTGPWSFEGDLDTALTVARQAKKD